MADARYAPAGSGDLLDDTARQAYDGDGGPVHAVKAFDYDPEVGRQYWTVCGRLLLRERGAVLTTAPAGCKPCSADALGAECRQADMVEAVLARGVRRA